MQKVQGLRVVIAGRNFDLDPAFIERSAGAAVREPVRDHFVVVAGERFPPKQILSLVTGLDRSDFTTYQARSVLKRLGFPTGRLSAPDTLSIEQADDSEKREILAEAEALRPYRGRWVALRDGSVIFSGDSPQAVLKWLRKNNQRSSLLKVPLDPSADIGGFSF